MPVNWQEAQQEAARTARWAVTMAKVRTPHPQPRRRVEEPNARGETRLANLRVFGQTSLYGGRNRRQIALWRSFVKS
jgi:hypothetical protein